MGKLCQILAFFSEIRKIICELIFSTIVYAVDLIVYINYNPKFYNIICYKSISSFLVDASNILHET